MHLGWTVMVVSFGKGPLALEGANEYQGAEIEENGYSEDCVL